MSRRLIILRHGKSAWDTGAPTDFERPLAKRGRNDAPKMGEWLRSQGFIPDYVISSPAERARQTVLLACKSMEFKKQDIHWDRRVYHASVNTLLQVVSEAPAKARSVMIVGHNPGFEELYHYLAKLDDTIPYEDTLVKTATAVILNMPDDWTQLAPMCASLARIQHPRDMAGAS
jgi:phosphohistidine phosphatase